MNKFDLQKLRDLPIEGVAQNMGMDVQKHKSLCPFHDDKHPSLSYHVRNNTFKCFVCDAHGGVIDLAMQVLGKDFKEACQWLSGEFRVESLEFRESRPDGNPYTLNPKPSTFTCIPTETFQVKSCTCS